MKKRMPLIILCFMSTFLFCMDEQTPLHKLFLAISSDEQEIVKELLNNDSSLLNAQLTEEFDAGPIGATALIHAIGTKQLGIAQMLLNHNDINVNLATKDGLTPLMLALRLDSHEIIPELLKKGANPNKQFTGDNEDKGRTAFMMALAEKNKQAADCLVDAPGTNFAIVDAYGATALIYAIIGGFDDIVKKMVVKKTDLAINQETTTELYGASEGTTALMIAIVDKKDALIKSLLTVNGIDVNQQTMISRYGEPSGTTPLMACLSSHNKEAAKMLLKVQGIDINLANADGQTALEIAVQIDASIEIITSIIDNPSIRLATIEAALEYISKKAFGWFERSPLEEQVTDLLQKKKSDMEMSTKAENNLLKSMTDLKKSLARLATKLR